jgi:hypothetical protein
MYKNFKKVRIANCKVREKEGLVLKKLFERQSENVEVSIAFDPDMSGAWTAYKKVFETQDDAEWLILSEDDISFPVDILKRIDHVLSFAPKEAFVFFYIPTNNQTKEAYDSGHKVVKTKYNWWPQLTAIPKGHRENFIKTIDTIWPKGSTSSDARIKKYIHCNNVEAYNIMPSIVQHLAPFRSSLGYVGSIGGNVRQSFCYEPNSDTFKIDWATEFKTPYFDKTPRGLIGFDGYENGMPLEKFNPTNGKKL